MFILGFSYDDNYLREFITVQVLPNMKGKGKFTIGICKDNYDDIQGKKLRKDSMMRISKIASDYGISSEIIDKENGKYEIQFYY